MSIGMNEETDLQLLERWQADDKRAGRTLVLRYHEDLARFFRNAVDDDQGKNLVGETFARFSKSHDAYRRDAGVQTHLFQIARRVLLDHLGGGSQSSPRTFDPLTHSVGDVSGTDRSQPVASIQDGTPLLDCLRALPVDTMLLLQLHHWHGCTPGELGKIFEQPQAVILQRLPAAMEALGRAVARKLADTGAVAAADLTRELEQSLRELGARFAVTRPSAPSA
jgi:DNA-directed RNA polymerase specialized sigma24 family protein